MLYEEEVNCPECGQIAILTSRDSTQLLDGRCPECDRYLYLDRKSNTVVYLPDINMYDYP